MTGPAAPRGLVRAMLDHERAAFTRPVTCPFWRWALAAGISAAAGSLLDISWVAGLVATTLPYLLVDWDHVRATWKGAP